MKKLPFNADRKKLLISLVVLLIGILAYTSLIDKVFQKTFLRKLDAAGNEYFDDAMTRAVYTFAVVRGLNGLISVIQGTDVAISPAGIGVQLAVGEVLDPVNDLIERFSLIMLLSTTSLGIQKILLEMGVWFGFKILLSLSMLILLVGIWTSHIFPKLNLMPVGYKLLFISLVIRFCIPAVALISENIYTLFLEKQYTESLKSLEKVNQEIKDADIIDEDGKTPKDDPGYWDALRKMYKDTKDAIDLRGKIMFLKDKISDYAKYIINLMIVFLLQTVIIPLCVLWGLIRLAAYIGGRPQPVPEKQTQYISNS
ncbi:MAG: hypothetical protein B6245_22715 [Desulfobacteraceae bacterium 4572_88]|nr:MAG: hypothetical protein B6245_22715 [Desulfobacteraceae bacterium 4572_88]